MPDTISPNAQKVLSAVYANKMYERVVPATDDLEGWRKAHAAGEQAGKAKNAKAVEMNQVTVTDAKLGGVPVVDVRPKNWKKKTKMKPLQHVGLFIVAVLVVNTALWVEAAKALDPLPSWNDGPTKSAIVQFVQDVTKQGGPKYVPPEARIATFDQDGTLWCEQPVGQLAFVTYRIKQLAPEHPEWKDQQPYKAVLEGDKNFLVNDLTHNHGKALEDKKMKTSKLMKLLLAGLMATSLMSTAWAKQAHVDKTITSISTSKAIPVTWKNFVRAESDKMFKSYVDMGAFGKFLHIPKPTPIDQQKVVRMNRDTIYSLGVFDLATPVTITKPDTGKRFQSMQVVNEDQYTPMVVYKPGKYTLTQEKMGTRYVFVVVRTLVDAEDPADVKKVNGIQQQTKVEQKSVGKFEIPNWDTASQDKIRAALKVLSATMDNYDGAFGSKDEVDPVKFLFASATGWGGNPQKDAMYAGVTPEKNDGKTAYTLNVKDVPVDGFWSISLYNGEGYFQKNPYNAYSVNNITGKKNKDGSMTIHFGGDPKQPNFLPIMKGWNYLVRLYQPRKEIMDGSWTFPKAQAVK